MTGKHTRAEILVELGAVVAHFREKREEIRATKEPVPERLDTRIECLQAGYEFIMDQWPV